MLLVAMAYHFVVAHIDLLAHTLNYPTTYSSNSQDPQPLSQQRHLMAIQQTHLNGLST